MKKIFLMLVLCLMMASVLSASVFADLAVGYETFIIFPHAFVLSCNHPESGWGIKASADFGTSLMSNTLNLATIISTVGLINPRFSFVTLALTKDIGKGDHFRDYLKAGIFEIYAQGSNGLNASGGIPLVGWGREWEHFIWDKTSGNVEIGYPELLTLGFKYHF
jgi:hypothetical protein